MSRPVRVRFAPSPTGFLHVGGLRTALYNYCFARAHGGRFILRIEDTDRTRFVPGAVEDILDSLSWAGIGHDEGPGVGGAYGPYFQSERLEHYRSAVDSLLASGSAYPCFCNEDRLHAMRAQLKERGLSTKYDRACLRLGLGEAAARRAAGEPHVIRLRIPDDPSVKLDDLVRGEVEISSEILDDQVLLKSDGFPTYHLANVVDDHAMEITHVIRGEEWLPSTPKHLLLYRFLGWEAPRFAHLPLLLGTDRSKLSKRQAEVAVSDYRRHGFFPEALVNFVAFLGWNPGDEREIFSVDELVREFRIERVNKSGAIFNLEKLHWFNQQYLQHRPLDETVRELRVLLADRGWDQLSGEALEGVVRLMRERVTFIAEIPERAAWFFVDPSEYEEATVKKRWKPESGSLLRAILPELETIDRFEAEVIEDAVSQCAERSGAGKADLIHPLRLACTGVGGGPGLYELMEVLGRETCLRRIVRALEVLV